MAKLTLHETALRDIGKKVDGDHSALRWFDQYRPVFTGPLAETVGSEPTPAMLMVATVTVKHSPGLEAVNIALALRPEGVKVKQYLNVSGAEGAAHNHFTGPNGLCQQGILEPQPKGASPKFGRLTEYGVKVVNEVMVARGYVTAPKAKKAAPVKVTRKRNAKAVPAETPASEAPAVTEAPTAEVAAPADLAALAEHFNA